MIIDVDAITAYETGQQSEGATIRMFGELIASGAVWILQGHYGRSAAGYIEAGYIDDYGNVLVELDYEDEQHDFITQGTEDPDVYNLCAVCGDAPDGTEHL